MAGLLDLFGGGGDQSGLYGDLLTPQQKSAITQRGLLGFLGGMQKSGALDYTAPFLSGKVPAGFAAGLAGGAAGMGEAQDAAGLNAMRGGLLGLQGKQLAANLEQMKQEQEIAKGLLGGAQGGGMAAAPSTAGPASAMSGGGASPGIGFDAARELALKAGFQGPAADIMAATSLAESGGDPNAANEKGEHSYGLTQINADAHGPVAREALGNPQRAMELAFKVSNGGTDFSPWTMFKNGGYKRYMPGQPMSGGSTAPMPDAGAGGGAPAGLLASIGNSTALGNSDAPALGGLLAQLAGGGASAAAPALAGNPGAGGINPNLPPATRPPGGILPLPASPAGPAPSGLLPPTAAAPGGNPMGIDPRAAAALAYLRTGRGAAVPQFLNEAAAMPFAGPKAAAEAAAKYPYDVGVKRSGLENVRPGGSVYDPFVGGSVYSAPTLQQPVDPATGEKSFAYMSPQGTQPTGSVAALGPGRTAELEQGGKNVANLSTPIAPPGSTGEADGSAKSLPGTALAANLNSTIPDYREPMLSAKQIEDASPKWREQSQGMVASIGQAQQAEHRLMSIAEAFKITQSGALATHKAELSALLKSAGINVPDALLNDPAQVQLALHENYRATLTNLAAVNKRFSQSEFLITSENSEHPNLQPEANLTMLAEDIGALRQAKGMATDWLTAQNAGKQNPEAFQTAWLNANPLSKISSAVKTEIGPLKGMSQGAPAPTATGPGGQRLILQDGQWRPFR